MKDRRKRSRNAVTLQSLEPGTIVTLVSRPDIRAKILRVGLMQVDVYVFPYEEDGVKLAAHYTGWGGSTLVTTDPHAS